MSFSTVTRFAEAWCSLEFDKHHGSSGVISLLTLLEFRVHLSYTRPVGSAKPKVMRR